MAALKILIVLCTLFSDPLLEFLFFWEGCFSKTSSAMAVVWKRSSSLVVYSLSSKKGNGEMTSESG